MTGDERIDQARLGYERSVFGGDHSLLDAADRALDAAEADLALARGRILHARFLAARRAAEAHEGQAGDGAAGADQPGDPRAAANARELALFEHAALLYRGLGDGRGEAEALFWTGCFHQVVGGDHAVAVPLLQRSRELADDPLILSYALRHLGFAEHLAGRPDLAREHLEASTRLRREVGFLPGVAANLVGLAHIAAGEGAADGTGRARAKALAMLDEAADLAVRTESHAILLQVDEARREIDVRREIDAGREFDARQAKES